MQEITKQRLVLLAVGLLLAATATTLSQILLVSEAVVDTEPYAVVVGLGVAMPLLLAGAYPQTETGDGGSQAVLIVAEVGGGAVAGVGAVALLVASELPTSLPVGGGAAATYVGAIAARAIVLGRLSVGKGESSAE